MTVVPSAIAEMGEGVFSGAWPRYGGTGASGAGPRRGGTGAGGARPRQVGEGGALPHQKVAGGRPIRAYGGTFPNGGCSPPGRRRASPRRREGSPASPERRWRQVNSREIKNRLHDLLRGWETAGK